MALLWWLLTATRIKVIQLVKFVIIYFNEFVILKIRMMLFTNLWYGSGIWTLSTEIEVEISSTDHAVDEIITYALSEFHERKRFK